MSDMDVFTVAEDVEVWVAGGPAVILNPFTFVVHTNEIAADSKVLIEEGTQVMRVGSFDKTDTWLLILSETGNFHSEGETYALVLRKKGWEALTSVSFPSEIAEHDIDMGEDEDPDLTEPDLDNFDDDITEEVPSEEEEEMPKPKPKTRTGFRDL